MSDQIWYLAGWNNQGGFLNELYDSGEFSIDGVILGPMNRINIFVGANNSGKSKLMRKIMHEGEQRIENNNKRIHDGLTALLALAKDSLVPNGLAEFPSDMSNIFNDKIKNSELAIILEKLQFSNVRISKEIISDEARALYHDASEYIKSRPSTSRNSQIGNRNQTFISYPQINQKIAHLTNLLKIILLLNTTEYAYVKETSISYRDGVHTKKATFFPRFEVPQFLNEALDSLSTLKDIKKKDLPINIKYIPILRSSHRLWDHENNNPDPKLLGATTKKNYEKELHKNADVFTGQELFSEIVKARNGDHSQRKRFEDFEKFIGLQFFRGQKVDIVAKIGDLSDIAKMRETILQQSIHVKIGDKPDRPIHELGDGIQALIILTFPIFMAEPDTMIFIEEPELNLHPGMQRIFLDVITNHEEIVKKNLTFFMTTHSNHFLDLTLTENAPVSIFSLRENEGKPPFEIRNVHSGQKGILELLGVQNSSVFIGNCSIWVEGHTDRKYIRKYLQELIKAKEFPNITEDLHYVFFEYSGANLAHYRFGDAASEHEKLETINGLRLNNAALVVGDNDQIEKSYLSQFQTMSEVGFKYRLLEQAKEIENLLSPCILSEVLPNVDGFKKKLKEKQSEIRNLNHDDYVKIPLREFIESKFNPAVAEDSEKNFSADQKRTICDLAVQKLSWDKMSCEARQLALAVYNFIAVENGMEEKILVEKDLEEPTCEPEPVTLPSEIEDDTPPI